MHQWSMRVPESYYFDNDEGRGEQTRAEIYYQVLQGCSHEVCWDTILRWLRFSLWSPCCGSVNGLWHMMVSQIVKSECGKELENKLRQWGGDGHYPLSHCPLPCQPMTFFPRLLKTALHTHFDSQA
ncbi:unnamed protein product [Discosporangium mesarthrocarpum]